MTNERTGMAVDNEEAMGPPTKKEEDRRRFIGSIGEMIFAIRWGLAPLYILMWVPVISYCGWFAQEVASFWIALYDDPPHRFAVGKFHIHLLHHNAEDFILWTLGLIDASMVANLLVMISIGGYSTFVKEFDLKALKGKPRWMNGLDSNTLKIKMAVSLIGVTAIQILRTVMDDVHQIEVMTTEHHPDPTMISLMWNNFGIQVASHLVFCITALVFTWNAKLLHGHNPRPGQHDQPVSNTTAETHTVSNAAAHAH